MKKAILVLIAAAALLAAAAGCADTGGSDDVRIRIGESERFARSEIEQAAGAVKDEFRSFEGCELVELWYDEEVSDAMTKVYLTSGRGAVNGAAAGDVIVLVSVFTVDETGGDGSMEPNSTYEGWNWILTRNGSGDKWRVDDWGY